MVTELTPGRALGSAGYRFLGSWYAPPNAGLRGRDVPAARLRRLGPSPFMARWARDVRGDRGVRLALENGKSLIIGSQQPEALAEAIRRALRPDPAVPRTTV